MPFPFYESITVADTAIGFTASIYQNNYVQSVTCTLETASIRFRLDGTDPTSAEGHLVPAGQSIKITGASIAKFKAIRTGAVSGVLRCSFE